MITTSLAPPSMDSLPPASLAGKRILVIEDNAENMRLFRAILKLEGIEILEADRARQGIEIAQREQPDLILMDIQMPEMDGLTATRLLKADPKTCAIPIVAVTASVTEKARAATLDAGCDAHVSKPIDIAAFVQQIEDVLHLNNKEPGQLR